MTRRRDGRHSHNSHPHPSVGVTRHDPCDDHPALRRSRHRAQRRRRVSPPDRRRPRRRRDLRQVPRRQRRQRRRRGGPARQPHRPDLRRRATTRSAGSCAPNSPGWVSTTRYVATHGEFPTPVTFCEIFPPDDFPLYFYRKPSAPDLQIHADEIDTDAVRSARLFWATVTGLSEEPSRSAHFAAWEARGRMPLTVLDLDYRPMFWGSPAAATEQVQQGAGPRHRRRRQPRGVRDRRRRVATRTRRPTRCSTSVSSWRSSSRARAVCSARAAARRSPCRPTRSTWSTAWAPGTRSAAACATACCSGWSLEKTLRYANAAGAIVAGRLECSTAMPTAAEVAALAEQTAEEAVNV